MDAPKLAWLVEGGIMETGPNTVTASDGRGELGEEVPGSAVQDHQGRVP